MRTTLQIDDDVYQAAKAFAEASGTSIGKVISDVFRRGLAARPGLDTAQTADGAFPTFPVRSHGIVTSEMVANALDDE
jgi:hypothetical protein